MAEWSPEATAAARQFRTRLSSAGLTVALARLYSQRVRVRNRQEGLETWASAEYQERLLDAVRLVDAALVGREHGEESASALRRAAEILEWLAEPSLGQDELALEPLSAACYQLAGYPARAAGVMAAGSEPVRRSLLGLLLAGPFVGEARR